MLPRLIIAVLALAAPGLAAQSASTQGMLQPDCAYWFLLQVGGEPTQDIDIDVHFTVSGPVLGRILDLDQYAKLEGIFEAAATSASGALDLRLGLPAREYGRLIAVELRHVTAGAAKVDYTMSATASAGKLQLLKIESVPMADFGMICLFNRMALFDAAYDAAGEGKCFKVHVDPMTYAGPPNGYFALVVQTEGLAEFVVTDEYWTGNYDKEPKKKTVILVQETPALPVGEIRTSVGLISHSSDYLWHTIYVPRPAGDPAARFRGEMVFADVSWVSARRSPNFGDNGGGCGATTIGELRDWSRLGPLGALVAVCAIGALWLRWRVARPRQFARGMA